MRKGKVFVGDYLAGIISEKAGEFTFEYDKEYLLKEGALPVRLECIDSSFIKNEQKVLFKELISQRLATLLK